MKEALEYLVNLILGEKVATISQEENQYGETTFLIKVKDNQAGKLIGKGGRIINAIRKVLKIRATKEKSRFLIKVEGEPVDAV